MTEAVENSQNWEQPIRVVHMGNNQSELENKKFLSRLFPEFIPYTESHE